MVAVYVDDSTGSAAREPSAARMRDAAAQFAGLLIQSALRPLASTLGFYGEAAVAGVAEAIARSERGGLTDRLAALLENAER
jgi:hypothetical protein